MVCALYIPFIIVMMAYISRFGLVVQRSACQHTHPGLNPLLRTSLLSSVFGVFTVLVLIAGARRVCMCVCAFVRACVRVRACST